VLAEKGFANAQTVEHLLRNEKLHQNVKNQVLLIDEAGLLDVRSMNGIFAIAKEQNARVILLGDSKQHASPRRGEALRLLEKEAGLNIARVESIQRQKGDYRRAVELISQGHTIVDETRGLSGLVAGFDLLDRMGKIKEISSGDRYAVLADQYMNSSKSNRSMLVVAPTHAEGEAVTQHIRSELRRAGAIGEREHEFVQLRPLNRSEAEKGERSTYDQPALIVQFHQNVKGGYTRGERYEVIQVSGGEKALRPVHGGSVKAIPYDAADRFEVYQQSTTRFAVGDKVRFTLGGKATDGKRQISNGRLDEVEGVDRNGDLRLKSGFTVSKDYGHWDYGVVVTSHASQGKDRDVAIAAIGSQSLPAVNARQFYVTVSRGREDVTIYVDDKQAVRRAIEQAGEQLSATELVRNQANAAGKLAVQQSCQREQFVHRVRSWWQRQIAVREWSRTTAHTRSHLIEMSPVLSRG
jgi:hypothetical protein